MKKTILILIILLTSLQIIAQDTINLTASFYHNKFNGRKTSSGQIYTDKKPSAASNKYPLGTKLLIINKTTGDTVTVIVNDRMANYIKKRIDLSKCAFKKIAPLANGLQKVHVIKIL